MYGNREMLKFGSILVSLIPILWILSKNPIYLIFIPQLVSGIGWAAFNLAASNFIYDSVTPQRRGICVAYYNLLNGLGVFMGAALGGFLANYLTISFMNKLLFIFLVSGILRIIVSFIMMPKIKEVRQKVAPPRRNPLSYLKEMKNIKEIRPIREVFEGISSISSTLIQAGIKAGRTAGKKGMVIFE
jgi:MFS family permease